MGAACCGSKHEVVQPTTIDPPPRDDGALKRSLKIGINQNDQSKLIDGYQYEPIVSLEEALQSFHGQIDRLAANIKEAKTRCHFPSEHNLTRDESAAIYIYTMRWADQCVFDHLQTAWKSEDRAQLQPWFKYLRLFRSGLNKLPNAKKEVWQGAAFDHRFMDKLEANPVVYTTMGSCLVAPDELKEFLREHAGKKIILVGYGLIDARAATAYTAHQSKEYIVWPGTKLGVAEYLVSEDDGSVTLHMVGQPNKPEQPIQQSRPLPKLKEKEVPKHFKCANTPFSPCSLSMRYLIIL
ncbi:unnamed protein product [Rotaria socialis]|uniref:Uncharacterized protein n=1 Tax=Rotaria socialis TaxID=392032 RepID=A0A817PPB5_9BILA|nr:unnamed protein product [Rotaria socialis]CAF3306319.1 unnamed protein product [Rotaria socialis]CAF3507729.1 unnamed protein product [Rotaria socialis]CAF3578922.1 unnamed protein product [Rotaria socialis]CAF4289011.1 unnamed protein product [Rotaria socialis]